MKDNKKHYDFIKQIFKLIILIYKELFIILKDFYKKLCKKLRFSITFKITTIYTIIFTKLLILLSLIIFFCFVFYTGKNTEDKLLRDNKIISSALKNSIDIPKNNLLQISELNNIYISVFDEQHKVIYTTNQSNASKILYSKQNKNGIYSLNDNYILVKQNSSKNNFYMILNNPSSWNSNNIYIQLTSDLSSEIISAEVLAVILLIIDSMFIFITITSGSKASKKMLKPIEAMTNTVKKINISAMDTRLDVSGSQDELKDLAETFNNMLDRIQNSYEIQNQFVSDASHELRTPIAVIQGYANLLDRWGKNDKSVLDESIKAIKDESEDMKHLVENLLFLARSDKNTQKVEKVFFPLNDLISEIIKETQLIDSNHKILNTKNEDINLYADPKLLKEALRIFIDNSIKYTPAQGTITIESFIQNNKVLIEISDTGIGISKEDLPNIFNRFYRADKSRTKETGGTGLGLSIAKWIILKHKGSIQVNSTINVGTKITLFLQL